MKTATRTVLLTLLLSALSLLASAASPQRATVPLIIEDQRLFVDAQFVGKDGSLRTARLWVDTGNPDFQITEKLARDLGLDLSGPQIKSDDGLPQIAVQLPGLQIGGLSLDLTSTKPMVIMGEHNVFAGSQTDGNLPSTILMHYQVALDVPKRNMTLAQPGAVKAKGKRVAGLVQHESGMMQMDATIDGQKYSLALDSGAPYSMISTDAIKSWTAKHQDWPQIIGAAGPANFLPPRLLRAPMMRIPQILWGDVALKGAGVVGMDAEFVSWYSKKTAARVIGFLSWNVVQAFRLTIDYPNSAVYFEKEGNIDAHDMDVVGITLARSRSGGYAVLAVVQKDGKPVVDGVQPGDKLLKVDDLDAAHADLQTILNHLRGKPGDVRTLTLDRKGTTVTATVKIIRLM